jgi:hypothetical protein
MRSLSIFLVLLLLAIITVVSVPDDLECVDQVTDHYAGAIAGPLLAGGLTKDLYTVEDDIFFKTVYFRPTGNRVAIAAIGHVFIN